MNKKTLKFDNIEVNKKEFHSSKQPITLSVVNVNQIVVFDKFERSDKGCKCFICYKDDNIIRALCMILLQMIGFIKYFENGGNSVYDDKYIKSKVKGFSRAVNTNV